jgi:hypothetical protein
MISIIQCGMPYGVLVQQGMDTLKDASVQVGYGGVKGGNTGDMYRVDIQVKLKVHR